MQTYEVLRDFPQNGKRYRKGDTINLTERQARHLRIGGFIKPAKPAKKPVEKKAPAAAPAVAPAEKKQGKGSK